MEAQETAYSLYDRYISCEITYTSDSGQKSIVIDCPEKGMKPDISISYKRVDGNFVYEATVTFTNLYLRINPANIDTIKLQMGYRGGAKGIHFIEMYLTVFASYAPEPGPDGTLVCECIVGKADTGLWGANGFNFWLYNNPKKWKVGDILGKQGIERYTHVRVDNFLSTELNNYTFSEKNIPRCEFSTFYTMIHWIQSVLNTLNKDKKVTTIMFNDRVVFIEMNSKGIANLDSKKSLTTEGARVPHLVLVENAEWNASILTVTAPFTPEIVPGTLFLINPKYFKASKSVPNSVARSGMMKDPMEAYFVITQQVSFATTGNTNRMVLTAIPYKWSPLQNQTNEVTKVSFEEHFKPYDKKAKAQDRNEYIDVPFGEISEEEDEVTRLAEELGMKDLVLNVSSTYTSEYEIGSNKGVSNSSPAAQKTDGSGLSAICGRPYFGLKPLRIKQKNKTGDISQINAGIAWTPFVLAATYTHYLKMRTSGVSSTEYNKFLIDIKAPDSIKTGRFLILPSSNLEWSTVKALYKEDMVRVFRTCAKYYYKLENKGNFAQAFDTAADAFESDEQEDGSWIVL